MLSILWISLLSWSLHWPLNFYFRVAAPLAGPLPDSFFWGIVLSDHHNFVIDPRYSFVILSEALFSRV